MKKKIVFLFCGLLFLCACQQEDMQQSSPKYVVKYAASWQKYQVGSVYLVRIYYKVHDSLKFQPYLQTDGSWSYNFEGVLHDTLKLKFTGTKNSASTSVNELRIYVNDQLIRQGSDSLYLIIQ